MGLLDNLPLVNPDDRKRNMLADLLRGATGLLDEARPKVQDSWRNGLLSILNPEANQQRASDYLNRQNVTVGGKPYDYNQAMLDMAITGIAPIGMLAYHGSPHTFDKFSLDKIGTGEGAQAYGHGLYLAESPDVARTYSADRAYVGAAMRGKPQNINYDDPAWIAQKTIDELGDSAKAKAHLEMVQRTAAKFQPPETRAAVQGAIDIITSGGVAPKGSLYKVDLPDEAVARFLDWDKKLSEQAPEVRQAITKLARSNEEVMTALQNGGMGDMKGNLLYANLQDIFTRNAKRNAVIGGEDAAKWTHDDISRMANGNDAFATQQLQQHGIPGIRYLDGGSRGAGTGTSNFVVFDPDMIRILERNGQSTGLEPWKPGEWK